MAPLKFEDKMKDRLEQRTIKPSEGSWEKLTAELDKQQHPKKGRKNIWWYSVAAVFTGIMILSFVWNSNNSETVGIDNRFVDATDGILEKDRKKNSVDKTNKEPLIAIEESVEQKSESRVGKTNSSETVVESSNNKSAITNQNNLVVKKTITEDKVFDANTEKKKVVGELVETSKGHKAGERKERELLSEDTIINSKVAGIVAEIKELQKNNVQVTDEEINQLLRIAQREITTEKYIKSSKVSASALLQDVEAEIDETFKQRVFEALKTGFEKVRTAVAEREN